MFYKCYTTVWVCWDTALLKVTVLLECYALSVDRLLFSFYFLLLLDLCRVDHNNDKLVSFQRKK